MSTENEKVVPEHTKLNIGCGFNKLNDHWNVDIEKRCNPDQVLDLEITPWPYEDSFFNKITANNILEHLGHSPKDFIRIFKEMYRVSGDQCEWYIQVPHHRCDLFWDDYTHVRVVTPRMLQLFDQVYNVHCISRQLADTVHGLLNDIDIEIVDLKFNIIEKWTKELKEGLIGHKELDLKLNTLNNVAETIEIFLKVHKPGRHYNYLK